MFTFAQLVYSSKYSILFIIGGISFILSKSEFNQRISSKWEYASICLTSLSAKVSQTDPISGFGNLE